MNAKLMHRNLRVARHWAWLGNKARCERLLHTELAAINGFEHRWRTNWCDDYTVIVYHGE